MGQVEAWCQDGFAGSSLFAFGGTTCLFPHQVCLDSFMRQKPTVEDLWWSLFSFSLLEVLSDSQLTQRPLAAAGEVRV